MLEIDMRGTTSRQVTMLGWIDPGELIPANHPIRKIRPLAEAALKDLEPTFERMYAQIGRPSIPPEQLPESCPWMALHSIRSERQLCERLRYDPLCFHVACAREPRLADVGHLLSALLAAALASASSVLITRRMAAR